MSILAASMMVPVAFAIPRTGVAASKLAAIEHVDREFVPYVTVLQAGTTASFPNRDPIQHHVYSFSPAKSFEITPLDRLRY